MSGSGPVVDEEAAVRRHAPLVYAVLRRVAHPPEWRDDLIQEGLIGLLEAVRGYDPSRGTAFSTFAVSRIWGHMRHVVRTHVRHAARTRPLEEGWAPAAGEDALDRLHSRLALEQALGALSAEQAHLLRRRFVDGVREAALAEVLGVSQPTVSRRVRRALLTLHQQLTGSPTQSNSARNRH